MIYVEGGLAKLCRSIILWFRYLHRSILPKLLRYRLLNLRSPILQQGSSYRTKEEERWKARNREMEAEKDEQWFDDEEEEEEEEKEQREKEKEAKEKDEKEKRAERSKGE